MAKKSGFTLAEVLITLGIIGVVAAMTIPNLIANTNSAKFKTGFKKSVSTLSQAALMGQAQYEMDYSGISACTKTNAILSQDTKGGNIEQSVCGLFNSTLSGATITSTNPYDKAYGASSGYPLQSGNHGVPSNTKADQWLLLADGSIVGFQKAMAGCTQKDGAPYTPGTNPTKGACLGYIDVNGTTLPNKYVTCDSTAAEGCKVPNTAANMTDVFPIYFHDTVVEPASWPAKTVMTTSK